MKTINMNLGKKGFTIVELLVVIVVIGILASITVVSYTGVTQKATVATLHSDLANAKKQIEIHKVLKGAYPTANNCPTPGITEICLKSSTGNTFSGYSSVGNSFSVAATNTNGTTYIITENLAPYIPSPITAIAAISGTAEVGQTLTAGALTPGTATASYQWQSSTTVGGTYTNISGATSSTYTLVVGDVNKYLKVVVTGTNSYSGTQTSVATAQIQSSPWIAGIAATALAGKFVRNVDLSGTYRYKNADTSVTAPQGATGLDPSHSSNMSLVNPQTNPGVDFSAYPAQNACKAVGGRLPNVQELQAIFNNQAAYGNNFQPSGYYWPSTESGPTDAYLLNVGGGGLPYNNKSYAYYVRCVFG